MSWTYDAAGLSSSALYQVRFEIGDTDSTKPQLQDEEINYLLTKYSDNVLLASYYAALGLVSKYTASMDRTVGSLSIQNSQRVDQYGKLVARLKAEMAKTATPIAGGYVSDGQGILLANPVNDDIRPETRTIVDGRTGYI